MTALDRWDNFYVIVGSSAGALIGLQFVVLTLIADVPVTGRDAQAGNAFATPSVIHFGAVLLLSAIISAPWDDTDIVAAFWGFLGLCGIVYTIIVARRMRAQDAYEPVFEDWLFHFLLPFFGYAAMAISACTAHSHTRSALFALAAAALVLLFTGIHNAWDAVMYHIFVRKREQKES